MISEPGNKAASASWLDPFDVSIYPKNSIKISYGSKRRPRQFYRSTDKTQKHNAFAMLYLETYSLITGNTDVEKLVACIWLDNQALSNYIRIYTYICAWWDDCGNYTNQQPVEHSMP